MTIDPATLEYRPFQRPRAAEPGRGQQDRRPRRARAKATIAADDPAGRFAWEIVAGTFIYSANRVPEICDDITEIDDAMRWGYAWDLGPFELWDALGVPETVERMKAEGRASRSGSRGWPPRTSPSFYSSATAQTAIWGLRPADRAHGAGARPRTIVLADLKATGKHPGRERSTPASSTSATGVACLEFHTKANIVSRGGHSASSRRRIERRGTRLRRARHRQPGRALLRRRRPQDDGRQASRPRTGTASTPRCATRSAPAWRSSTRRCRSWPPRSGASWAAASRSACTARASRPTPTSAWAWSRRASASCRPPAASRRRCCAPWRRTPARRSCSPSCASRSRPSPWPRPRAPRWDAADMGYLRGGDGITMNRESVDLRGQAGGAGAC